MGELCLKNLAIKTIIGLYPSERKQKQLIFINLRLTFDSKQAEHSDKIKNTIDYDTLSKKLTANVKKTKFHLIEALANHILSVIFKDKIIKRAHLKITKPSGIKNAESVSFIIIRDNK